MKDGSFSPPNTLHVNTVMRLLVCPPLRQGTPLHSACRDSVSAGTSLGHFASAGLRERKSSQACTLILVFMNEYWVHRQLFYGVRTLSKTMCMLRQKCVHISQ
ncbi:hypothetical protein AMECASPLE_039133 [Ameca splendens]|uniref:Uncharacterized protein n=1 Tax=Ameca splendens TaxID=208324 RepID=A0ABV0Y8A2_9TELE